MLKRCLAQRLAMACVLKLHRDVERQLKRIPARDRERLVGAMRSLRDEPRPAGCLKLAGVLHRIREGQYRIIYGIFDAEVVVVVCKVARRTESTYRDLQALLERAARELSSH
jgi:mRNA interferase RelE/StbE